MCHHLSLSNNAFSFITINFMAVAMKILETNTLQPLKKDVIFMTVVFVLLVSSFWPLSFQLVSDFSSSDICLLTWGNENEFKSNLFMKCRKNLQVPNKLNKYFLFTFLRQKRFSQNFIDIREKERKRGARGLVTVPTKTELGNETSADNATVVTTLSPEEQAKADDMLKLQQKITQELLNSNLKENERNELQVRNKTS